MAGVPDAFQRLWTPHRYAYLQGQDKPADDSAEECPFCRVPGLPDDEGLVVARGELAFAVLNLYPYNPGHLMVCPYRHVADYTDLTDDEVAEVAALTRSAMRVLRHVSSPARLQPRHEPGPGGRGGRGRAPAPARRARAGAGTPTSCPSSPGPRPCRSCSPRPARCSPTPGRTRASPAAARDGPAAARRARPGARGRGHRPQRRHGRRARSAWSSARSCSGRRAGSSSGPG